MTSERRRTAVAAVEAKAGEARIYSRGTASRESAAPPLAPALLAAVGRADWFDVKELIDAATHHPPPSRSGPPRSWPATIAVSLDRFYGSSVTRVLMAAPPRPW